MEQEVRSVPVLASCTNFDTNMASKGRQFIHYIALYSTQF